MVPVYAVIVPLGTALRQLRRAQHLTQRELAQRSGLGRRTIQRIERGERQRPRDETLAGLARAVDLPVDQLKQALGIGAVVQPLPGAPERDQRTLPQMTSYESRADRLIRLFLALTPAQQDQLESVALALHSTRPGRRHLTADGGAGDPQ